jgi:hypothetical protein
MTVLGGLSGQKENQGRRTWEKHGISAKYVRDPGGKEAK